MKSNYRIFGAVFLTAIYCFALGFVTNSFKYSDFRNISEPPQELIFTHFTENLFCHTVKSESSVSGFNNLPASGFKNYFIGLLAYVKATDSLFETAISLYSTLFGNILLSYAESDIIFPAHYFW